MAYSPSSTRGSGTLGKGFYVAEATWMGLTAEAPLPTAPQELRSFSLWKDLGVVSQLQLTTYKPSPAPRHSAVWNYYF